MPSWQICRKISVKNPKKRWKQFSQKHFFIKRLGMHFWQKYPDFLVKKKMLKNWTDLWNKKIQKSSSSNTFSRHVKSDFDKYAESLPKKIWQVFGQSTIKFWRVSFISKTKVSSKKIIKTLLKQFRQTLSFSANVIKKSH